MAYDEVLADRLRSILEAYPEYAERRMFGGIAFMLGGHLACGVVRGVLMVRVGPDEYEDALARPEAEEFDFTGKPMRGIVQVDRDALDDDAMLRQWVERGIDHAMLLPPRMQGDSGPTA